MSKLILGEASEQLKFWQEGTFDAVVTDPPFGIGFDYSGKKETHDDPAKYWEWLGPIIADCKRVLKPGGFLAVG